MPELFMVGGPNGAGKTTTALQFLPRTGTLEFVNADFIASGLSPLNPAGQARAAGRLMLERLDLLRGKRQSFAFETTMASKTFVSLLERCKDDGFVVHLIFVWLESANLARERVARRVASGGHHIPDDVVERRYGRGILNFLTLYAPLADTWTVINNSAVTAELVARKNVKNDVEIFQPHVWASILKWEAP